MMKRTPFRLVLCSCLTLAVLAFIWGNSLLPGEDSGELSGFVGTLLQKILPFLKLDTDTGMHLLRKTAHFTEFAALGWCFTWLYGMLVRKRLPGTVLPFLSGAAAAAIDETIQRFSPDRGPSIKDVTLDSCGVLAGILVLTLIHLIYCYIKNKR